MSGFKSLPRSVFGIVGLLLLQILFVASYVSVEHTIYFWDHAMYYGMARQLLAAFGQGFDTGWATLSASLNQDYNLIFALPSLLSFTLFGETRLVFILTNFFVFFVPYEIAAAWVLRRVYDFDWRTSLLLSLGVALFIPPLWLPLLEGYPDNGGALGVTLALALLLGKDRGWRTALLTGLALAFGILLRRHFLYPALAIGFIAVAADLISLVKQKNGIGGYKKFVCFYGLIGLVVLTVLYFVAPGFLENIIGVDYVTLYASYKKPAGIFLGFMVGGTGLLLCAATLGGLVAAWRKAPETRQKLAVVAAWFLAWLVIWCAGSSMAGHHYMLHTVPMLVAVGLGGLAKFYAGSRSWMKKHVAVIFILLLAGNGSYALWFSADGVKPNSNGTIGFFSAARPPVVRKDYESLMALGQYLKANTKPNDRIYVVASSFYLNQDLMVRVFTDVLGEPAMAARFQYGPEIDGEQPPPLDVFASSTIYLVPEPPQYHLDPAGQTVITAAAKQFPPPKERAAFFSVDPQIFALEDGVNVRVWRRSGWTPMLWQQALASIRMIASGAKQDWAAWREPRGMAMRSDDRATTHISAAFDAARSDMQVMFDRVIPAGDYRLGLDVATNCGDPRFTLETMTPDGKVLTTGHFAPVLVPGSAYHFFNIPAHQTGYVRMGMAVTTAGRCVAEIAGLRIEQSTVQP